MDINYQIVVEMVVNIMTIAFPIALIFMICQKITGIFVAFVMGKDVSF
jgi:hypothetical protein